MIRSCLLNLKVRISIQRPKLQIILVRIIKISSFKHKAEQFKYITDKTGLYKSRSSNLFSSEGKQFGRDEPGRLCYRYRYTDQISGWI